MWRTCMLGLIHYYNTLSHNVIAVQPYAMLSLLLSHGAPAAHTQRQHETRLDLVGRGHPRRWNTEKAYVTRLRSRTMLGWHRRTGCDAPSRGYREPSIPTVLPSVQH